MEKRSHLSIVHSTVDVNKWAQNRPSVEEARPCRCPRCGAAARPIGGRLGLLGHGGRSRQVLGPFAPHALPEARVIHLRRYRCRTCKAVATVVPRAVVPRRHYGAWAICLALYVVGIAKKSFANARRAVSPRSTYEKAWPTLRRWIRAQAEGRLFGLHRRGAPSGWTYRHHAGRIAAALIALVPSGAGDTFFRLFAGVRLAC